MQICFFIENDGPTEISLDIGEGVRWKKALTHISHGFDGLICVISCHENTKQLPALGGRLVVGWWFTWFTLHPLMVQWKMKG